MKSPSDHKSDDWVLKAADLIFRIKNQRLARSYRKNSGRWPNIAQPQLYSERMLWRKIVDHNPQFVCFSDKLATKEYIRERCPELALPRTLWIGQNADEIPPELLRGNVFVKTNHGCDFNFRIRDGVYDGTKLQRQTKEWLGSIYGQDQRQWAYSQVQPKLFVEAAIGDVETGLLEFNVRASNGQALLGSVMGFAKTPRQWSVYLDAAGNLTPGMNTPEGSPADPLPAGISIAEPYQRAVRFTERLSLGVDYARFDFMWNGQELFAGEITVYPAAGMGDPANASANAKVMNGWDLSQSHFLKSQHTGWKRIYANALKRKLNKISSVPD